MARQKRQSPAVQRAKDRAAALAAVDAALDLGKGLTLLAYNKQIENTETMLSKYNEDLSNLDAALNRLQAVEDELDALSNRMLKGVAAAFGEDSDEYEKAGGTRRSERKRPGRRAPTAKPQ